MDEPFWGSAKIMIKITFCFKKWPFVTAPVDFYVNFPENHDFDDLDKGVMDILNLMCSDGPERWLGPQNGLKRDPESSRSNMRSEKVQVSYYRDIYLTGGVGASDRLHDAGRWEPN